MPELPEVEITRRKLLPLVRGLRILGFWTNWVRGLRVPGIGRRVSVDMVGRKILDVTRRGKVLFFPLSGRPPRMMAIHLRMSGRLAVVRAAKETKGTKGIKERWTHFTWRLSGNHELRFVDPRKFGVVWYGAPKELSADPYLGRLGADISSLGMQAFLAVLSSGAGMAKPFLLRQDKFSGIGNIIADESLWRARIHPRAAIAALPEPKRRKLFYAIQHTIRAMLSSGGTSIRTFRHPDGEAGRYQERRLVYGKAGKLCPRCRARLLRVVVGGRGTTICPQCQKIPNHKFQITNKLE